MRKEWKDNSERSGSFMIFSNSPVFELGHIGRFARMDSRRMIVSAI